MGKDCPRNHAGAKALHLAHPLNRSCPVPGCNPKEDTRMLTRH
jgi:hypothetical protein